VPNYEAAKRVFQTAVAKGQTATLLEQQIADVFHQSIGNVKPHSRITIRITYVTDLKVEADGSTRFVLPMAVAPRYTPSGCSWSKPWTALCSDLVQRPNSNRPAAFSCAIDIVMSSTVLGVTSPTHSVSWESCGLGAGGQVKLCSETVSMACDLVLNIVQEHPHQPHVELEVAPDGSGCAMLTLVLFSLSCHRFPTLSLRPIQQSWSFWLTVLARWQALRSKPPKRRFCTW
jgi:hypothetical protein